MELWEVFFTLTYGGKPMTDTITRETCDRCGPAVAAATLTSEGLTFCAHCARKYQRPVERHLTALDLDLFVIDTARQPDEPVEETSVHQRPATADPNFPGIG